MYIKKNQAVYTVAIYRETASGGIDFRISGTFINQRESISAGNKEVEYYESKGYHFTENGWGDMGATKYVWQGHTSNGDFPWVWCHLKCCL